MPAEETDYRRYLSLIRKKKTLFAVVALSIMTLAVLASYLAPKKYEAKSTVFIEKSLLGELIKGIAVTQSMDDSLKVLNYALTSRTLLVKVINEVDFGRKSKSDAEIEQLLAAIRRDIDIKVNEKDQNLFVISYRHQNPRLARDFVNALVQRYIEENVSAKREASYDASKFLGEQIAAYKQRLEKAEATVNQFKSSRGAVATIDDGKLLQEIGTAQQKLYDLQLRRRQLEEEKSYAKSASDPVRVKLTALTKRLEELRSQYTEEYPDVVDVKGQIESLQKSLGSDRREGSAGVLTPQELWKIDAELKAVHENEGNLSRYIAREQAVLNSIPNAKASLDKLEGDKANNKNMYDLLFLRQNQSEVSKQIELQDKNTVFRVVDPAVTPVYPVSPNRKKIMLAGIFGGLAAAFGLVLALDLADPSVKTVDGVRGLGLPVLAVIPLIESEEEILAERQGEIRICLWGGCFFTLIVAVLVMELAGASPADAVAGRLSLPAPVAQLLDRL